MVPVTDTIRNSVTTSYHLQGIVFKTIKIYITMSKLSKDKKQTLDEEKPIVNPRKKYIGFLEEDFINEYLEEDTKYNNKLLFGNVSSKNIKGEEE